MAVAASEAGRRAGVSSALAGLLDWPRELGRSAAAHASWAGWLLLRLAGRAGRASCGPSSFLFLFLFYFSSPLFKFQIDLEFEFKIGVPYSLEF